MRRYWWIQLLAVICGAAIGYLYSRSTSNRYVVQAAFLMERDNSSREYERLLSRKLVADATAFFQVSRWIDHGAQGWYEMYNESPFLVTVVAVTREVQNQPLALRLLAGNRFALSLPAQDGVHTFEGKLGEVASFPGIQLSVVATKALDQRDLDAQYFVSFNSANAVANRFLSNLEVVHLMGHEDRIGLVYTDDHPVLALDMLTAFTNAYLLEFQNQRVSLFTERLREVNAEMKVLEAQIMAFDGADPFLRELATAGSHLAGADTAVISLLNQRLKIAKLDHRLAILEAFQTGTMTAESLDQEVQDWVVVDPEDSVLLASGPAKTMAAYQQRLSELKSGILDTQSEFLAAASLKRIWEKQWLGEDDRGYSYALLLREKYLAAMEESAHIELEMRKDMRGPQLIDPPYPTGVLGRSLRIKNFVTSILGSTFLGVALALGLCMTDRRYRNYIHFAAMGVEAQSSVLKWNSGSRASQQQLVDLELRWGKTCKRIAFIGDPENAGAIVRDLATRLCDFGLKIAVIGVPKLAEHTPFTHVEIASATSWGWWFSSEAHAKVQAIAAENDHILICLPFPHLDPEAVAVLTQMEMSYVFVQKGNNAVADWKRWKAYASELKLDYQAIWLE